MARSIVSFFPLIIVPIDARNAKILSLAVVASVSIVIRPDSSIWTTPRIRFVGRPANPGFLGAYAPFILFNRPRGRRTLQIMKLLSFAEKAPMETGISALEQTLEELWRRVRQSNLYGGRPRNSVSEESVVEARSALARAQTSGDPRFLREAWHMMAYALAANEQWVDAIVYYRQAIPVFEEAGEIQRAARMRLGFISSLTLTGQSREALAVAAEADQIFRQSGDNASLAKLATNLGAVYQRLDNY